MKQRNPFAVFFLPFITLGIYGLVWQVKTKGEMNRLGSNIPTAWLLIVPIVNYYWLWKYSEGVEQVTGDKLSAPISFILLFLLGSIGAAIVQSEFNKVSGQSVATTTDAPAQPVQPVAESAPQTAQFTPVTPIAPAESIAPTAPSEPAQTTITPTEPTPPSTPTPPTTPLVQ